MQLKNLLAVAVIGATTTMVGCGSDSDDNDGTPAASDALRPYTGSALTVGQACGDVGEFSGVEVLMADDTYTPLCDLNGRITQDATLTADFAYRLNGYVTVGEGSAETDAINASKLDDEGTDQEIVDYMKGAGSATLTIEPGVHFRSTGRGSLVISRGSQIQANGTAADPIVMSSIDAGIEGQGEWGGLVLQGFAKNNDCGDGATGSTDLLCDAADEAGTGFHGGNDDADNSGSIQYVIVAEGGFEIAPDQEVNGITLHSVGYGTTIENVMVYANADDGIEWFGGAANVKNLILVDNGDESLDWDNGWRGNVQFVLARQGVNYEGDYGIEADTEGPDAQGGSMPESDPVVSNVTFQENSLGADHLFRFKEGTNGTLVNIAADGYSKCIRNEDGLTENSLDVELDNILLECAIFDNNTYSKDGNADGLTFTDGETIANVGDKTVALGVAFEVTGGNGSVTANTPSSANGSTGFFEEVDYVGAVDPAVTAKENAWWYWAEAVIPAAFQ